MKTAQAPLDARKKIMTQAKRLVIKVGSRLLTDMGDTGKRERIDTLIAQIAQARKQHYEVVLVSSGAIGAGMRLLNIKKRPRSLPQLQAMAALGQSRLMALYENACANHGFHCAQILLSRDDLRNRSRNINIRNCLNALLAKKILPIINENDTVSVDEIRLGDNDLLAGLMAAMLRADLTILLTTVNGMRERHNGQLGKRISFVTTLSKNLRSMAGGTDGNAFSTGGMDTKLKAAEICMAAGENLWIADGRDFSVLTRILQGEDVGTLFVPENGDRMTGAKRYLAFCSEPAGQIKIDAGAVQALQKGGKSLLPSGIIEIRGTFSTGDTVLVLAPDEQEIGLGMSNFSAAELEQIRGLRSEQIQATLTRDSDTEAIHRDNMVIWDEQIPPPHNLPASVS